jgi:hypothetical protein
MKRSVVAAATGLLLSTVLPVAGGGEGGGRGTRQAGNAGQVTVLTGVVVTDEASPRPMRRATVRVSGDGLASARDIGTDDEGRFVFRDLPAGSFVVSASKPGYVDAFHGARRPGRGPGVPVAVAAGTSVDVVLRMLPGAVITGFVTDSFGGPAPDVRVSAVELGGGGTTTSQALTDDRGVYRIFGLSPGEYVVSAVSGLRSRQQGAYGAPGEILYTTEREAQWARTIMDRAGASPTALVTSLPPAGGSPTTRVTPVPPAGRPVAYAPVYHPGTTNLAVASSIVVAAGEERSGVDLALQLVPLARLEGRLVDDAGQPVTPAVVTLLPRRRDRPSLADRLVEGGALVLPRAAVMPPQFTIAGVPPGEYTLVARTGSAGLRATVDELDNERLWGVLDVTVTGSDQEGLVLRVAPGLQLDGRVVFNGTIPGRPDDSSRVNVELSAIGAGLGLASLSRAEVDPQGRLRFRSIAPGSYVLRAALPASAMAAGWALESAMLDGLDISDRPLVVEPGASRLDGLEVTLTDRAAEISGRLIDAGGQPATGYAIVIATTDRGFWLPNARRIRSVQPATDGSFRVSGLPPGEYAIAALLDVHEVDLADPAFLTTLVDLGYIVALDPGDVVRQDLRAGG